MSAPYCNVEVVEQQAPAQVSFSLKQVLYKAFATVSLWHARAQQRHKLRISLEDEDFLKDIGVSLWDARVEANKPFWK
jgi:uncharacterized protein YjiS (DUF1127 family)